MAKDIEARLKISAVDKSGAVLRQVAERLGQLNRRAGDFNRMQSTMARTAAVAGSAVMRYAAPAALAYGAKAAFMDFAEVERRMTRIGITAGATREETEAAFSSLQKMAKDVSLTVDPAISALDTLTASGMDLKEAMDFMPSVLATAQASGAATEDIANTAMKTASALKIEASQMQRAFDILVTGGKLGQFELDDMSQYIPSLANAFATLGYQGEDGLKRLVTILQVVRDNTGDASSAATQAGEIFGKMYSQDTATKFKKMGIDLRKELKAASSNGEDVIDAFRRISLKAINGDLSKLPLLFTDKEFRLGMTSLITGGERATEVFKELNSVGIDGTVFRDLKRVTDDAQASIDRMSDSWEKLKNSTGKASAPLATYIMDSASDSLDYESAMRKSMEEDGKWWIQREGWIMKELALGFLRGRDAEDAQAYKGGYGSPEWRYAHEVKTLKAVNGLDIPMPEEFSPGTLKRDAKGRLLEFPVPQARPEQQSGMISPPPLNLLRGAPRLPSQGRELPVEMRDGNAALAEYINSRLAQSSKDAADNIANGGKEGASAFDGAAAAIRAAGQEAATAIRNAVSGVSVPTPYNGARPRQGVNANLGRSMPPAAGAPE